MKKIIFVLLLLFVVHGLVGQVKNNTEWWLYTYEDYARTTGKHDPRVKWATQVFHRVAGGVDKVEDRTPRFYILANTNAPPAISVPDGGILISPVALEICYGDSGRPEGDRRMAFVLGHELGHLSNKDFIHHEFYTHLKKHGGAGVRGEVKKEIQSTKEFLADQKGALFAAMAGYNVSRLLGKKNNFLRQWARRTGGGGGDSGHPDMKTRVQSARTQIAAVVDQIECFRAGVLLYQVENFHDAKSAFRRFALKYPAREVFNNIGACYLQLALSHLHFKYKDDYYRFRLSCGIDYTTTAETHMTPRGESYYLRDKSISGYLEHAADYFNRASERDKKDRWSRYNLSAVLILQKDFARAQSVCKEILKISPGDVLAINNNAVAFYHYGKELDLDTTQKAIQLLQDAHKSGPKNFEVLYNLAVLKGGRKRLAAARLDWEKYLNMAPRDNFYNHIHKKLKGAKPAPPHPGSKPPLPPKGLHLGDDVSQLEKRWGKGAVRAFKLGTSDGESGDGWATEMKVMVKNGLRVVALSGTIEVIEREEKPGGPIGHVIKKYGPPQRVHRFSGGNFYVYSDRGFSLKEVAGELRSITWFERDF